MKKYLLVLASLAIVVATATAQSAFRDVGPDTAYRSAISWFASRGIVTGYPSGDFGIRQPISRAEFLKTILIVQNQTVPVEQNKYNLKKRFQDVFPSMWYAKYVNFAYSRGIISGYSDGTFRPNSPITRAEVLQIIFREMGMMDLTSADLSQYVSLVKLSTTGCIDEYIEDIYDLDWYGFTVISSHEMCIIPGEMIENNKFYPNRYITRSEALEITYRTMALLDAPTAIPRYSLDLEPSEFLHERNLIRQAPNQP